MKRRHVVALLGFFSFGGAAAVWHLLNRSGGPIRSILPAPPEDPSSPFENPAVALPSLKGS
jgi:hypothetical protein